MFVLGLKDKALREKLEIAMSVMAGQITLEEMVRKAVDIQSKQEGMQLISSMRGLYGGKGVLVVADGSPGDDVHDGAGTSSGDGKLESQLAVLAETVSNLAQSTNAALAGGGFKQAGKFTAGERSSRGADAAAEPEPSERGGWPKCPTCGGMHRGRC